MAGAPADRFWRADRSWVGYPVVIVGGGASLSLTQIREIGMARAADLIRVIAINDAVYPCWFADAVHCCDARWWHHHGPLPGFIGLKLSLVDDHLPAGVMLMRNTGESGIDDDPGSLRTGRNGGYQALQIAVHMGATTIVLVGYDMHGHHWFGHHPPEVSAFRGNPVMASRIKLFAHLAPTLKERGIRVVNASPGTILESFERGDLVTELRRA